MVGYSPWGRKELDTTKRLTLSFSIIQEGCYNQKGPQKWKRRKNQRRTRTNTAGFEEGGEGQEPRNAGSL